MLIYHYQSQTGEYQGSSAADVSPLEPGVYLVPAGATTVEPPAVGAHACACFIGGDWQSVADYRTVALWSMTTGERVQAALGDTLQSLGATTLEPAGDHLRWDATAEHWVTDTAAVSAAAQQAAITRLSTLMQAANSQVAILQDAVSLAMATPAETELLNRWKQYRVLLNRVPAQSGYPLTVDWPVVPE